MDYSTFNAKDPNSWAAHNTDATQAVRGINNMPFVMLGNNNPYGQMANLSPQEVYSLLYRSGGLSPAVNPAQASPLLSLLGLM